MDIYYLTIDGTVVFLRARVQLISWGAIGTTDISWEIAFKRSALECDVTQPEVVVYGIRANS